MGLSPRNLLADSQMFPKAFLPAVRVFVSVGLAPGEGGAQNAVLGGPGGNEYRPLLAAGEKAGTKEKPAIRERNSERTRT